MKKKYPPEVANQIIERKINAALGHFSKAYKKYEPYKKTPLDPYGVVKEQSFKSLMENDKIKKLIPKEHLGCEMKRRNQ